MESTSALGHHCNGPAQRGQPGLATATPALARPSCRGHCVKGLQTAEKANVWQRRTASVAHVSLVGLEQAPILRTRTLESSQCACTQMGSPSRRPATRMSSLSETPRCSDQAAVPDPVRGKRARHRDHISGGHIGHAVHNRLERAVTTRGACAGVSERKGYGDPEWMHKGLRRQGLSEQPSVLWKDDVLAQERGVRVGNQARKRCTLETCFASSVTRKKKK